MPKFGQNIFASRTFVDYGVGEAAYGDMPGFSLRIENSAKPTRQATPDAGAAGRPDNYQSVESAWNIPGPNALIDVYTPDENTTGTLVVDGAHVIAASDVPGDNDWFKVTLTAGQTYQFGQYAYAGGVLGAEGAGVPLADAYLEIYDSAGNLLALADGGGPNTPNGLDALLTFEAPTTGTYYVNATSFDNDGDGVGDFVGDYEIFAKTATPGTTYVTPYDISSPLHSIDWGGVRVNREHVAVRNPDGMEGPRPTGQPAADPATVAGNFLGYPGKNVIFLYFGGEDDVYAHPDSTIPAQLVLQDPYQYEVQAMLTAANEFSKVADVVFVSNYTFNASTGLWERDESIEYKPGPLGPEAGKKYAAGVDGDGFDADFFYFSYAGTPGPGVSLLGSMNPPDYADEGVAQFNSGDERWTAQMLQPGGFSFVTLIHEFGHGMGLAHPHDTGGGSSIMQDENTASGYVEEPTPINYTRGTEGLNQGIYTVMSYNFGWETSPYGQPSDINEGYGWLSSLMAFDIAVIQDKYGVNEDWATGNDTYVLKDTHEWGVYIDAATGQPAQHDASDAQTTRDGYYQGQSTSYSSIWDAGGVDQITYNGARDTKIDLRPASLKYEAGGGGWMSYATGIYGGYTIANGVTIENATSGSGNDWINGNGADNRLDGGAGNDTLISWNGFDTLIGGEGNDVLYFGNNFTSQDSAQAGNGRDALVLQGNYTITLSGANISGIESVSLQSGSNTKFGDNTNNFYDFNISTADNLVAAGQQLIVNGQSLRVGEDFTFNGSAESDGKFLVYGGHGVDNLTGGAGVDVFFFEGTRWGASDRVDGGAGRDAIVISGGNGVTHIEFAADALTNIESISLNNHYASDPSATPSYEIVLNNGNVASVGTLIVNGNSLAGASQYVSVNGSAVVSGNLILFGGAGNDTLVGGSGSDTLFGAGRQDNLTGGAGADTFRYDATTDSTAGTADLIHDFLGGVDKIDLSRIDADTGTAGDQAFTWIGSNAFSGAGQLRLVFENGFYRVEGDTNGDGTADLTILFGAGTAPLVQSDFVL